MRMEHGKEFYESVVRVIDFLTPKDVWDVKPEKGEELAGDYWPEIGRMFKEELHIGWFEHNQFRISRRERLASLRKDCEHIIETLNKAEADRNLANCEKIENITYGRKGYKLSKIAIWLSAVAILVEITRGILDLL